MSKYTTEVRYICEKYAGLDVSADYLSIGEIIERARGTVFNFNYPIFDESYRSVLETKILKHFYTREIGEESVGLWKLRLNTKMNEIMPYYNQRYESELIKFNPLYDTDLATSRDDKFESNRNDNNVRNTIDGGSDIVNTHTTDNTTLSGSDSVNQTGTIARAHSGYDNVAYDDRDSANDDTTSETWTNEKTTDMHYESDTPQSTIAGINDNNYATSFTKDTHERKNDSLNPNSDNYIKTRDKTEHNNHNDTRTSYNDTVTDTYNKVDTTNYGKVTDNTVDNQKALTYGKTRAQGDNLNRDFNSTDAWLEHIIGKRNNKSYSQMLNEFRTTFLNIDMEVINELNDLFFNLW